MRTSRKFKVSSFKIIVFLACGLQFAVCSVFLSGCAATHHRSTLRNVTASDYIDIESFCEKYNFEYHFDTIDDVLRISSRDGEIKVLLNSLVASFNGPVFYLKKAPVYFKGKIFLPRQLEKIVSSKSFTSFKPLFSVETIVIDPGHGGKDPGAISASGFKEKTVNLKVSKYLKEKLEKQGFKVFLTRTEDVFLSLQERIDIAQKYNADICVSIHANANHSSKVEGLEIYYLSPLQVNSRERSAKIAETESFRGKNITFDAKAILWDMLIDKNYSFSVEFSNILYFNFKNLGFKTKPPKKACFYVLKYARTPSVLVEMGYLTNQYEEKALRQQHYQKQIAEIIALSISSLKKRYNLDSNPVEGGLTPSR
ncbi:MAG: N-acetylmuramoyl-L-alanine amidase [Candidatus Omnitrophota bacterium]